MSETQSRFSLAGKVAVVTGALGLLGKQHCEALAEAGARVVATDLDEARCEAFASTLPNASLGIGMNITEPESLVRCRDRVLRETNRLDVLVNNAAINDRFESPALAAEQSKFEAYTLALWKQSVEVNLTGTFLASQILGGVMAARGAGSIINVASTYGIVAPDQSLYRKPDGTQAFYKSPAYPATKAAVIGFTKFLAAYWGHQGVRVNALAPGGVENAQDDFFVKQYAQRTPLGRMATPEDYRGAVVFLASEASAYMTGATLVVDGGWTAW